jgi:hypothetical protein
VSFHSCEKITPSNLGIKQLERALGAPVLDAADDLACRDTFAIGDALHDASGFGCEIPIRRRIAPINDAVDPVPVEECGVKTGRIFRKIYYEAVIDHVECRNHCEPLLSGHDRTPLVPLHDRIRQNTHHKKIAKALRVPQELDMISVQAVKDPICEDADHGIGRGSVAKGASVVDALSFALRSRTAISKALAITSRQAT